MGVPINNVPRRVVFAADGVGPYAFTFEILAAGDIAVFRDDLLLTLTTDYTVTINPDGTGSVTLVADPTSATQIAIVGNRTIQRISDFVTGGDFFANTLNDELDQQTIFNQQNAEAVDRALKAPQTDPLNIDMTLPRASVRANKTLAFDTDGNPTTGEQIGDYRGDWAAGTAYNKRDLIKDTSDNNVYICIVAHTSSGSQPISTNADVDKWDLIVDAASAAEDAAAAAASAAAAAGSATAAASSASAASTSATNAANSATAAGTSATNAASSATAAAGSATTASTAATNAGNSATAAATSATNASNSASAAATSATNASNSASAASTSASNAATSATNAANSASTATTQASNAATSATNAASSATAAANSATAAAASYDEFDDRFLGAKTSNPTVDNDGNALLTGALYFNSVANEMRVWNGTAWQAVASLPDLVVESSFTATAGQTSAAFGMGGYRVGFLYVYVNGVLLAAADITATDGSNVTFAAALAAGDEVRMLTFKAVGSVTTADIGALNANNPNYTGTLTGGTGVINIGSGQLYKDASGNVGIGTSSPSVRLDVSGVVNANGVVIGTNTDSINKANGNLFVQTTTAHDLVLRTNSAERMRITSAGNVGIGTSSPSTRLHAQVSAASASTQQIFTALANNSSDTVNTSLRVDATPALGSSSSVNIAATTTGAANSANLTFSTRNSGTEAERMRIDSSGNVLFNDTSTSASQVSYFQAGRGSLLFKNSVTTASHTAQFINPNGTVGQIFTTGSSTTYATSSDYRLKHDIQPMTGALAKVAQLKPVTYKWNADDSQSQGFIAHELQEVVPECVTGEKDAVDEQGKPVYQGIDTSFLVATLTAAIQEQQAIINDLKARLDAANL
jgi:hypothetical protein